MAYLARCVTDILQQEYSNKSSSHSVKIYLLYAPTFLDHINSHCFSYFSTSKLLDNLIQQFPFLSFHYIQLQLVNSHIYSTVPKCFQELFSDSIRDSIYRDLTPGLNAFDYYKSSPDGRIEIYNNRLTML